MFFTPLPVELTTSNQLFAHTDVVIQQTSHHTIKALLSSEIYL